MINNEFHIIGVAVSNFELQQGSFPKYQLTVEVERSGKIAGAVNTFVIEFYQKNNAINFNNKMIGKTVVVGGYLDSFTYNQNQKPTVRLIGLNMLAIDNEIETAKVYTPPKEPNNLVAEEEDLPF